MTISVSTGTLGALIGSLLQSADNVVEKLVFDKVESLGKKVIEDLIKSTPLGAGLSASKRVMELINSDNSRDFKRGRDEWLNSLRPSQASGTKSRLSNKIQKAFDDELAKKRPDRPEKGFWKWSKSRQQWLNEDWKHDWRSQPRDKIGRWIEGRLNYIYVAKGRASKKVRSARRRYARKIINLKNIKYENSFDGS